MGRDVETPVAKVVGEVDVATMDHHGNRDAVNEFQARSTVSAAAQIAHHYPERR